MVVFARLDFRSPYEIRSQEQKMRKPKPPEFLVYGLIDPRDSTLRYVGKSSSGLIRPRSHFCPCRLREQTHAAHWIRSVIAAGLKPQIVILDTASDEPALNEAEAFFITYFKFLGCRLTNLTSGGEGARGVIPSAGTRAKMSAASLGRKKTPAHSAAISAGLKGHAVSDEVREKLSAAHKGNKYCLGRKLSEDSRKKMSESVKRTSVARGKKRSPEVIAKIRETVKNRSQSPMGRSWLPTFAVPDAVLDQLRDWNPRLTKAFYCEERSCCDSFTLSSLLGTVQGIQDPSNLQEHNEGDHPHEKCSTVL